MWLRRINGRPGPMLLGLALILTACHPPVGDMACRSPAGDRPLDTGYGVLQVFLADERHLKLLRIAKTVLTLQVISEPTKGLVDDIAATSSTALDELDRLVSLRPVVVPQESLPSPIAQDTLDALRKTTARELILSRADFETVLLVSQAQSLRVTSHLARELAKLDPNTRRQAWLGALSRRLEKFYDRVIARLRVALQGVDTLKRLNDARDDG
jgi:hypothetical protein